MSTSLPSRSRADGAPPSGDIDDLFDYDLGLDEALGDVSSHANKAPNSNSNNVDPTADSAGAGLGLDEEIKVTRKRQPVAKLDEARLLSQNGIPKLRRTAKTKLKFKGKGHEFSDAARLLNFYQFWLDDLYPRAKFADGLTMIEKLGHSKRIQVMRREWIDEGKPRLYERDEDREWERERDGETRVPADQGPVPLAPMFQNGRTSPSESHDTVPTDIRDGEPAGNSGSGGAVRSIFGGGPSSADADADADIGNSNDLFVPDGGKSTPAPGQDRSGNDDVPEEDDLDALLAEQDAMEEEHAVQPSNPTKAAPRPPDEDNFDDEMEAMGGMW